MINFTTIKKLILNINRKTVYFLVFFCVSAPVLLGIKLSPAPIRTADDSFKIVDDKNNAVLISIDFGPGTQAELYSQAELVIEHLLRKKTPFALMTLYDQAMPFLEAIPEGVIKRLKSEGIEDIVYGRDWINFGYQPNFQFAIINMAKSDDLSETLKTDFYGKNLRDFPIMGKIKNIKDFTVLFENSGLVGIFNLWIQFFQKDGFKPLFIHGCTSISIPDAYNYYSSKLISGLFEGISGAAWYEKLMQQNYPNRIATKSDLINTSVSFGQLLIIILIILGNLSLFFNKNG